MSKLAEYKQDLAELMDTYNDSSTPKEVKESLSPAIEKLKTLIKETESDKPSVVEKKAETKKEAPTKKPTEAKKPQPKKEEPKAEPKAEGKSKTALEKCKEILAKYNKQKKTSAKRVEQRRKQGKPATLTPSETLSKAAKSVKSKVVEMKAQNPKGLSQGQKDSLKTNIIKSVQSALAGIVGAKDKHKFVNDLIAALKSMGSKLPKVAEGGAVLSSMLGGLDANPRFSPDSAFFMEHGGNLEDSNAEMLHSNVVTMVHHSKEISDLLKLGLAIEPWVLAKSERASTDLSDITHYLEGKASEGKMNFATGGRLLSALNRDRNYKSNQSWEQRYTRKRKPKNPKYSYANGGMLTDDEAIEMANDYLHYEMQDYNEEPITDPMVARRIIAEMEREDDNVGAFEEGGLMSDRMNNPYHIGDQVEYDGEEYTIVIGRGGIVHLKNEQGHLISPESPMWNKILKEGSVNRKFDEYADGGIMAMGGEIEEGDIVLVKSENLNAEVVRIVGDNVVVEFTNRRPEGGDKRRNYKKKDLKKISDDDYMAMGGAVEHGIKGGDKINRTHGSLMFVTDAEGEGYVINVEKGKRITKDEYMDMSDSEKSEFSGGKYPTMADGGYMAKGGEIGDIYTKMYRDTYQEKQFNKKIDKKRELDNYATKNKITIDNNNIIYVDGERIGYINKINQKTGQQKTNWDFVKFEDGGYMAKGGMVVSSIKDIPNFKERLEQGKITYRGLGSNKLANDFYKATGTTGVRIKVDGVEYFITDEEFDTFSRDSNGKMRIRFDAPARKGYADGGMMDEGIVYEKKKIDGEVEDDEYGTFEIYKEGGNIKVKITNEGEKFTKDRYGWLLNDYDKDGIANVDDTNPYDNKIAKPVDKPNISRGIETLISLKNTMDDNMYSFVDELKSIAPDNSVIYARTKTPYSIIDKLIKKRLLNPKTGLTDLIGTTIVTNDKNELDEVKAMVDSGKLGRVIELEDMYQKPKDGYRAYHYLIEKNGMPVELQLKTKRQKAINKLSHEAYKLGKLDSAKLIHMTEVADRSDRGDKDAIAEYDKFMQQDNLDKAFYKNESNMANGGEIMKHKYQEYITIELLEPTNKGWKVKQIETHNSYGNKLAKPKERIEYYSKAEIKDLFNKVERDEQMEKGGGVSKNKKFLFKTKVNGAFGEYHIVVNAYDQEDALEKTRYFAVGENAKLIGKPIKTTDKFVDGVRIIQNQYWRIFAEKGGMMAEGGKVQMKEVDKEGIKLKYHFADENLYVDEDTLDYLIDLRNPSLHTSQFKRTPVKDVFLMDTMYLDNDEFEELSKVFNKKFKRGGSIKKGSATFDDKVNAIQKSLLKRGKVPVKVQKDYGKKFNPKEALESAKRIAGSLRNMELKK